MPSVTLIAYTPEPERTVASAARLCYSSVNISEIQQGLTERKAADFVAMLSEIGHESPIEHASFTFGIEGVSRSFLAQMTRHRLASYSVQSQRYVREDQFEYVTPPAIAQNPAANKLFIETMEHCQSAYKALAEILQQDASPGERKKAEKRAIEDARFVLPNACTTKMMVSMNARTLLNFFAHRCCNRAQWEIREVADQMLRLVIEIAPNLFMNAGPPCLNGSCPEGRMSCGRSEEVRARYKAMHSTHDGGLTL